jgi:hypothetical protein
MCCTAAPSGEFSCVRLCCPVIINVGAVLQSALEQQYNTVDLLAPDV